MLAASVNAYQFRIFHGRALINTYGLELKELEKCLSYLTIPRFRFQIFYYVGYGRPVNLQMLRLRLEI